MLFTKKDFEIIKNELSNFKANNLQAWNEYKKDIISKHDYNNLNMRLCFDLWNGLHICNKLPYEPYKLPYNDNHIFTAMSKACKNLELI